jgi:hypothetical protein
MTPESMLHYSVSIIQVRMEHIWNREESPKNLHASADEGIRSTVEELSRLLSRAGKERSEE